MLLLILSGVLLPVRLAWGIEVDGFEQGVECTIEVLFLIDIWVNFHMSYRDTKVSALMQTKEL